MTRGHYFYYGVLGAPLAMSALPVYIHTPRLYGEELGLGLALTGLILLLSRSVDTLQDPWLGKLSDAMQLRPSGWKVLISLSAGSLIVAYTALFNPLAESRAGLSIWLGLTLVLVYTAHSLLNITYLAWGARASRIGSERTRLVAYREGFALAGVILASLLPMILARWFDLQQSWLIFSLAFAIVLVPAVWILLQNLPVPPPHLAEPQSMFRPLRHKPFRRLALLFLLNGLAMALPATLALFYIADVLELESLSGLFLALYFISGACSLPAWLRVAGRIGKTRSWILGTLIAVFGFVWAVQLNAGDLIPYVIICILAGAALGADLALPAAIAADLIPREERGNTGSYFGIWSLIGKAVLALSAGVALPMLTLFDYQPGEQSGLLALALLYAGVPCLIKLASALLLLRWRPSLEKQHEF